MNKVIAAGLILAGLVAVVAMITFLAPRGGNTPLVDDASAFVIQPSPDDAGNFSAVLGARPIPAFDAPGSSVLAALDGSTVSGLLPSDSPGAIVVAVQPAPEDDASGGDGLQSVIVPTYSWVNAFSDDSTLNGGPLPVGSLVTAFDPEGTLIGRFVVQRAGEYGAMPLYMDDPATLLDEGASPGDQIRLNINGLSAVILGPSDPIWVENGASLLLNIAGGSVVID